MCNKFSTSSILTEQQTEGETSCQIQWKLCLVCINTFALDAFICIKLGQAQMFDVLPGCTVIRHLWMYSSEKSSLLTMNFIFYFVRGRLFFSFLFLKYHSVIKLTSNTKTGSNHLVLDYCNQRKHLNILRAPNEGILTRSLYKREKSSFFSGV